MKKKTKDDIFVNTLYRPSVSPVAQARHACIVLAHYTNRLQSSDNYIAFTILALSFIKAQRTAENSTQLNWKSQLSWVEFLAVRWV